MKRASDIGTPVVYISLMIRSLSGFALRTPDFPGPYFGECTFAYDYLVVALATSIEGLLRLEDF